jgi:hypothetical protein
MTPTTQPHGPDADAFGAEVFLEDEPRTCPWCGTVEATAWLLNNNHWVKPQGHTGYDWCEAHGMCIATDLTRNHVLYYARVLTDPSYQRGRCACYEHRAWQADCARAALERCIARAEEVWPLPRRAWIEEYCMLATPLDAPEHAPVAESEAVALW